MRNKRRNRGKGISVKELLEREISAYNNETIDADNIQEDMYYQEDIPSSDNNISEYTEEYEEDIEELDEDIEDSFDDDYSDNENLSENISVKKVKSKKSSKNSKNKLRRNKGKIGNAVLAAACAFVVLCFAAYLIIAFGYYSNRFLKGTVLNGNDVSNVTTEEFIDTLSSNADSYTLAVMNNDSEIDIINGADIGLKISDEGINAINSFCSSQNKIMWPMSFLDKKYEFNIDNIASFDDDLLTSVVQNSKGYNLPKTIQNEAASLKYNDGKYEVAPFTNGDEIDKEAYMARIKEYVSCLKNTMVIQDADVYVKTEGNAENEQALKAACDKANEIIRDTSISVRTKDTNEDITADVMNGILSIDENYNVSLDDNTINAYISELKKKYNNIGITRTFKTGHGTEVQVQGGDYGCSINTKNLAADIKNAIFNKKPVETTVGFTKNVLSGTGADVGESYIEVDLTNQYLYMFIDGKKVKECPVVTGLPGARATPQGTYMLKNKMMDVPLVGENYVTPVKFWMPFNGGIGLHDAVWQSKFGGELYKTKGSHGCVNLMMSDAADIYKNAIVKMPVICYYHSRIASFQPVASSSPVKGTYRPLTDKELKMRDDLRKGKKINDSNVVHDSVTDNKPEITSSQNSNTADSENNSGDNVIKDIVVTPASDE